MAKSDVRIKISLRNDITKGLKDIRKRFADFNNSLGKTLKKTGAINKFADFKKLSSNFKTVITVTKKSREELEKLKTAFLAGNAAMSPENFKRLSKEIAALARQEKFLLKEQRKVTTGFLGVQNRLKNASAAMLKFKLRIINVKNTLRLLKTSLSKTTQGFRNFAGILGRIGGVLKNLTLGVGLGLGAAFAFVIKATADFERFGLQIQAVNRDIVKTSREFADLRKEAAKSPLTTAEFIESFTRLKALGVREAADTTKLLGQVAAVFGRDLRDITAAFVSLEARTLRRIGVNITRTGTKAIIESGNQLRVVEKTTASIQKAIKGIFKIRFGDAFDFIRNSITGQFRTLESLIVDIAAQIGDRTIKAPLLKALQGVNDFLQANQRLIANFFGELVNNTEKTIELIVSSFDAGFEKLKNSSKGVKGIEDSFSKNLKKAFISGAAILLDAVSGIAVNLSKVIAFGVKVGAREAIEELKALKDKALGNTRESKLLKRLSITKRISEWERNIFNIRRTGRKVSFFSKDEFNIKFAENRITDLKKKLDSLNKELTDDPRSRLNAQFKRDSESLLIDLGETNRNLLSKFATDFGDFGSSTIALFKSMGLSFNEFFFEPFVERFKTISQKADIKQLITDLQKLKNLSDLRKSGKKAVGLELIDTKNIQKNLSGFKKETLATEKVLVSNLVKLKAQLDEFERTPTNRGEHISILRKRIVKLGASIKEIEETKSLLKFAGQLNLFDKIAEANLITVEQRLKALKEGGILDDLSLGSMILDDLVADNPEFKAKFAEFLGGLTEKFKSSIESQSALKKSFNRFLLTDLETAKKITLKLIEGSFKNIPLPTELLRSINRVDGTFTKLFQGILKGSIESEKSVGKILRIFNILKKGGGDTKLFKDLVRQAEPLRAFNKAILETKGSFADFGKDINFLDKQSEGAITKQLQDSIKRIGNFKIMGIKLPITAPDDAAINEALRDMQGTVQKFLDSPDFKGKADFINLLVGKLKLPEGLQQEFKNFIETQNITVTQLINNLGNVKNKFVETVGSLTFQLEQAKDKINNPIRLINSTILTIPENAKLRFMELAAALQSAGKLTIDNVRVLVDNFKANLEADKVTDPIIEAIDGLRSKLESTKDVLVRVAGGIREEVRDIFLDGIEFLRITNTLDAQSIKDLAKTFDQKKEKTGRGGAGGAGQDARDEISRTKKVITEAMVEVAGSITNNATSALGDLITGVKSAKDAFKDFASQVINDIGRMTAKLIILNTISPLVGGLFGSITGGFFAKGGITGGSIDARMPIRGLSKGGVSNQTELAVIGEGSRAEAVVPLPDNRNIPVEFKNKRKERPTEQPVVVNINLNAIDTQNGVEFIARNQKVISSIVIDAIDKNRNVRQQLNIRRRR